MRAGLLDRQITLQSRTLATTGDPTAFTYTTVDTVWAQKLDPRGMERFTGSQVAARATQGYRIRYRTDVDPTWRVLDGSEEWNVVGTPESEGRRDSIVLLVTRLDPQDASS